MYYAGIGARKTPQNILDKMNGLAAYLSINGFTLRSGGAHGADNAFAYGATQNMEIYLPWSSYNETSVAMTTKNKQGVNIQSNVCDLSLKLAASYHPNWSACSIGVKKLLARNNYQILGKNLNTPSSFVVCWTPNGEITGGTGQALRVAKAHNIEIINFGNTSLKDIEKRILELS